MARLTIRLMLATMLVGVCNAPGILAQPPPPEASPESQSSKEKEQAGNQGASSEKPVQVKDVVITGTATLHPQKDSPVEIERITDKMIEQAGATNVRQVLQDVPAIESRRAPGGFQTFQIQGLPSIHTLFLRNGQELIGTAEGATFTRDLLASPEIESIEIVKGAAAVQYGSDAIGGVINLRTRKATQPVGARVLGQYGRFNTVTTFGAPEFRLGKFGGYLSAGVHSSDGFDLRQADARTDGDPEFSTKNASGHFDYQLSPNATVSLYTHYTNDDRKTKQNRTATIPSIREIKATTQRTQTILRLDWSPDAVSTFTLWGHHQVFQSDSSTFRLDTGARTALSRRTQELWEPQIQYTRQVDRHNLVTIGGEHDLRRGRGQSLKGGSAELTESALWAQDEIAVLPWLGILLGGRYTSNSEFGDFFSPQTTLLLKPGNFRGRFTYTRGFRSPSLDEVAFNFVEPGGVGVVGNPGLEPEKSTSFTANAEYYWERAKIGASVFRHDVSNLIEFLPRCTAAEAGSLSVPSSLCFKAGNITEARSQGFELEAGVKPLEWLSLESGYMYLDARDQTTDAFLFRRSPHAWKTRIRMEYAGWDFTTRMRYFSSFGFTDLNRNNRIDPNDKAPANLQLDVRLARRLKQGIELYGGVENLTAARMNVSAGLLPPPGVRLWFVGLRMAL